MATDRASRYRERYGYTAGELEEYRLKKQRRIEQATKDTLPCRNHVHVTAKNDSDLDEWARLRDWYYPDKEDKTDLLACRFPYCPNRFDREFPEYRVVASDETLPISDHEAAIRALHPPG